MASATSASGFSSPRPSTGPNSASTGTWSFRAASRRSRTTFASSPTSSSSRGRNLKVLGISGSLRRDSYNSLLLENARELLPAGVELELYDGLKDVPPFDEDDEAEPAPAVERL